MVTKMKWNKITESLPTETTKCLVYTGNSDVYKRVVFAHYLHKRKIFKYQDEPTQVRGVSHWCIPEPPKDLTK